MKLFFSPQAQPSEADIAAELAQIQAEAVAQDPRLGEVCRGRIILYYIYIYTAGIQKPICFDIEWY